MTDTTAIAQEQIAFIIAEQMQHWHKLGMGAQEVMRALNPHRDFVFLSPTWDDVRQEARKQYQTLGDATDLAIKNIVQSMDKSTAKRAITSMYETGEITATEAENMIQKYGLRGA